MKQKVVFFISVCSLMLTSCWKSDEFEEFRIEPMQQTWAFKLVNSTLCFKEVVERNDANTIVDVAPGSTLYFMSFRDTLNAGLAGDMFQLAPRVFNSNVSAPGGLPGIFPAGTQVSHSQSVTESFEAITGVELKRIDFSSGFIRLRIQNNFHHSASGALIVNSVLDNVQSPVTLPFNLGVFGSSISETLPLDPLHLDLYDTGSDSYNMLGFTVNLTVTSSGDANTSGSLGVEIEFITPDFEIIIGKFNQTFSTGNQEMQIAVFNNTVLATQHFSQPTMNYKVANSFGVPVRFRYSKFEVSNNAGLVTEVINDGTPTASDMNLTGYNVLNYVESTNILTPAITSFTLGYLNSNIEEIFDDAPNKLSYISEVTLGDDTDSHDYFVKKTSQIQFFSDITVPLTGWATTHLLSDTLGAIEFPKLSEMGISDTLDYSLSLKIKFSNELPLNMDFQVEFLDATNNLLDELFEESEEPLILSPEIDANGESVGVKAGYATILVSKEKYNIFKDASKLVLLYKLSSGGTSSQIVRVLSTNKVTIEMSVIVTATIDPQSM